MFAGIDSESVYAAETSPRLYRSKSAYTRSSPQHSRRNRPADDRGAFRPDQNPFLDPAEMASQAAAYEEEFGWSGSASGIRGRDDRQIERDAEYERKMDERTRKRHERKLARQLQEQCGQNTGSTCAPGGSRNGDSTRPPRYDQVASSTSKTTAPAPTNPTPALSFSPDCNTQRKLDHPSPSAANLNRGKSLREKVGAAFGRFNTISRGKAHNRSKSVGALDHPSSARQHDDHHPSPERKQGLIRRLSRKLVSDDPESRRREQEHSTYEPPLLSHTLVGPASPFPMRPALSTLVPTQRLRYGEAHTDYSPNPYRRRESSCEAHQTPNRPLHKTAS